MICFLDRSFCSSDCINRECPRNFTPELKRAAEGPTPVAFANYREGCNSYLAPAAVCVTCGFGPGDHRPGIACSDVNAIALACKDCNWIRWHWRPCVGCTCGAKGAGIDPAEHTGGADVHRV